MRVRQRAGVKLLRADSGFWSKKLIARLERAGWQYSISVRMQAAVRDAIAQIPVASDGHGASRRAAQEKPAVSFVAGTAA